MTVTDPAIEGASPGAASRFRGWRVVTGCFVVLAVNAGLGFYGLAVYLNAFSKEQGWALGSISLAVTIFFVVSGLVGIWVADLIARHDVRYVIVAGALVGGLALTLVGQVGERWQLYATYVLFAVGFALSGLVPATTVVTRWFHAKRSVALSVASTGLSVGGIALTPVAKRLIDTHGLGTATPWLGVGFAVGIVPAALFLVRPDPARDGYAPDGALVDRGGPPPPAGTVFDEAIRTRFYRAVTYGYVLALGSQVGGIQQLVKLVEDRSDARTAQFAITALAATSVVARLIGGRLVAVVPMTRFTVGLAAVQAVALVGIGWSGSTALIFVFIVLFGATVGNLLMMQPLLIAERFGVRDYPRVFGRSQAVGILGLAGGPLLIGWLFDRFGAYDWPYTIAAACCAVGAVVIASAGPATFAGDDDAHR